MSSTKKVVIILSIIAVVCLIGAGIVVAANFSGATGWGELFGGSKFAIDEREELDLAGVEKLSINCTSGDVAFVASDEAKATLTGTVISAREQDEYLKVYREGDTLHVDVDHKSHFFDIQTNMDLTIYLASDNMLDLMVDSTSGNMDMAGMSFGETVIINTSGDAKIESCTAESLEYQSTSGNTDIISSDLGSVNIQSTSGDIEISDTQGDITIRSTSGNTDIMGADGVVDIGSTSGDVTIDMASAKIAPVSVQVSSGDVRIYMFENTAFDLMAKTTSGNVSSDMDIVVTGSLKKPIVGDDVNGSANGGGALVRAQTTSGDVRIIKK